MARPTAALLRVAIAGFLSLVVTPVWGQTTPVVYIGFATCSFGNVDPTGVETILSFYPANLNGRITTATFVWSASPCPAAVKIKVFRPAVKPFVELATYPSFGFVAERGPFDVTAPLTAGSPDIPQAIQTVTLTPPIEVQAGDIIAITNLTSCGGPAYVDRCGVGPPPPFGSFAASGDVTSAVTPGPQSAPIYLLATGDATSLGLLLGRFVVTMNATDPRSGNATVGGPILLSDSAGYFSLPTFTGQPTLPEVTVKMVDATGSPALGGDFWFFYAPLTDVNYVLTVEDQNTGAVKTYSNTLGSPGQLCGQADTSAFPGP